MVYGALSLFSSILSCLGDLLGDLLSLVLYVLGCVGDVFSGFLSLIGKLGNALLQRSVGVSDEPFGIVNGFLSLLLFGLLTGACLGGNVTPIGASANVTAIGILRRRGIAVRFRDFMSISVPFTIVAVLASSIFVWIVWHT